MEKQSHDWRHQTKLLTTPLQHPSLNIHPTCWSSRWVIINALQSAPVWHCKGCFKSLLQKSTSHAGSQRSRDPSRSLHFDAPTCLVNKMISFVKLQTRYYVTTVLSIRIFRNFCLTRGVQALPFDCLLVRSHQPSTVQRLLWLHRHLVHMQQWGHCSDYLHGVFHEKWLLHSEKIFCKSQLSNTTRTLNNAKQRVWRDPNSNSKISLSECILCIQGWLYNDINPLYIQRNMTCIDLLICILCPSEKPEWNFRRRSPQRKEHYIGLSGL